MAKPDPRIREIQVIGNIHVFLVHGEQVRREWNIDFTMGANSQARSWMPQSPPEIWIDDSNQAEEQFILLHELHEYNEMLDLGIGYERAHSAANIMEQKARDNSYKLPKLLGREIARAIKIQAELAQDGKPDTYDKPFFTVMDEQDFKESEHPRGKGGKFATGSGGGSSPSRSGGSPSGGSPSSSSHHPAFTVEGKLTPGAHAAVKDWMNGAMLIRRASSGHPVEAEDPDEEGGFVSKAQADRINRQAVVLQEAASSSKTKHDHLYRGESYEKEDLPKFKEGQVLTIDRLTSTSGDRDVADSFASNEEQAKNGQGVLYVFDGPDKKGLDLDAALPGSKWKEDETIIPIGEHYRITMVHKTQGMTTVHAMRVGGDKRARAVQASVGDGYTATQIKKVVDEEVKQPEEELTTENDPRFSVNIADLIFTSALTEEEPDDDDDDEFGPPIPEAEAPPATRMIHIYEKES